MKKQIRIIGTIEVPEATEKELMDWLKFELCKDTALNINNPLANIELEFKKISIEVE